MPGMNFKPFGSSMLAADQYYGLICILYADRTGFPAPGDDHDARKYNALNLNIMRAIIVAAILFFSSDLIYAQIKAVTETGDEVILYQDGTWKYLNKAEAANSEIILNEKEFTKSKNSTFLVRSKKVNIGIWMNPKDWNFTKGSENEAAEYQFQKKGGDLYAMLISEGMQIPVETLKGIAVQNAKDAAPDITIIREEYRKVNGIKVLMMQMSGTIQGMRFTYFGYYYSNKNGTIQLLAYTGENMFKNYVNDIELFLNGLVEL
jgi:hypothetical protein